MLILEACDFKKYYGDRLILSLKSLTVKSEDKIGVVGRNGAGKSTFLNILAGEVKEDEGIVKRYCSISYIKQFSNENITAYGRILKEFEVEKKVDAEKVSGGERTKLNIAAALSREGELLLADEPTSNLDYRSICILKSKLQKIETFILISHDRELMDSLLNIIAGKSGLIYKVPRATIGYLYQDFANLEGDKSIIENVMETSVQDEGAVRTILARLLFTGNDVYKKVSLLSGGERIKASFAKLFVSGANVLLLDEPTNYLDLQSIEALEDVLKIYEGTVVFVSHDSKFINFTADRMILLKDGKITEFDGNLKEFEEHQKLKKGSEEHKMEKSVLQMKLTEIISRMSLPGSDKEMLEVEYKDVLNRLKSLDKK